MRLFHASGLAMLVWGLASAHAAAPWIPVPGPEGGTANRLLMDGSRVCAATKVGVYCTAPEAADWQPVFLEGKNVQDLVAIKSGWVAVLMENNPDSPGYPFYRAYRSQDGGTSWSPLDRKPWVIDEVSRSLGSRLLHAYGDSLLSRRTTADGYPHLDLSEDGGRTWKPLPEDGFPGEKYLVDCIPSSQSVLCVADRLVYRLSSLDQPGAWNRVSLSGDHWNLHFENGRIYDQDSLGVTVFGPTGREKRLPATSLNIFFASDSILLAKSRLYNEFAILRGGSTSWTQFAPPPGTLQGLRTGVWTGRETLFLSRYWSPQRVKLEPGQIACEPFSRGLRSISFSSVGAAGRSLLAWNPEAVTRRDFTGAWSTLFRGETAIQSFWQSKGMAMVEVGPVSPATFFSNDTGKTWHQPPASLVGKAYGMIRVGDRILALAEPRKNDTAGVSQGWYGRLYEADDVLGSWSLRAEYDTSEHLSELAVCGARLFARGILGVSYSLDTGRTWIPIQSMQGRQLSFQGEGMRLFVSDNGGSVFEPRDCGEEFELLPAPTGLTGVWSAFHLAAGLQLAAFYDRTLLESRVHPLSGSSPEWNGIEEQVLPGYVTDLLMLDGVLYASLYEKGLYAMDPLSARVSPGARSRAASSPQRLGGWRRVDGRALPPGAVPAQTPRFRSGFAR